MHGACYAKRMVNIDTTKMDSTLIGARPTSASWETATDQVGKHATLVVGDPDGIVAHVPVMVVGWAPAFGRSRWLVRSADGQQETVAAERLRL